MFSRGIKALYKPSNFVRMRAFSSAPVRLTGPEVQDKLSTVPEWEQRGEAIFRKYEFGDFNAALGFMNRVGIHAERLQHHPEWFNVYNRVEVTLNTHDATPAQGVTVKDFELAKLMDEEASMH